MPMSFPDMKALISAAEIHNFRAPNEGESEEDFRRRLANHVQTIDLVESMEIRTGKGWDEFTDKENREMLLRNF